MAGIKAWVEEYDAVVKEVEDLRLMPEFVKEGVVTEQELDEQYARAMHRIEELELRNMLRRDEDRMGAIMDINSGAGGTEALDWAGMLLRMYTRWGEAHGYKVKVLDYQAGEEVGVKSCTLEFEGEYAYGYLKSENGVHRMVRLSPFNANNKRQTTFEKYIGRVLGRFLVNFAMFRFIPPLFRNILLNNRIGKVSRTAEICSDTYFTGKRIVIGERVFINKFCKFFSHTKMGSDIIIGDDVAIAMGVTLTTHTHQISSGKRRAERKTVFRPIVIGDGCWIGANVTILPGVTIGRGTVVGAGSVVVKDLDANSVYVGNPARKIRQLEG